MPLTSFARFSVRAPGIWARCMAASAALVLSPWASAGPASEADLQMLEIFGVSDIVSANNGNGPVAGILQAGNGNRASIEQSGVGNLAPGNLAQVWQQGDNNLAKVVQDGYSNEVRLWQEGYDHIAYLTQIGSDNKIAAAQYGSGSVLNGWQNGTGNQAAVVLMGKSNLTFEQRGNNNVIEQTMPLNMSLQIYQIGDGMSAHFLTTYKAN